MSILSYIKEKGIKHTIHVLYRYKVGNVLNKVCLGLFGTKPLKNTIVIESHNDFDCNGGAMYDYLIAHGYNRKYKIVWLLKNKLRGQLPENVTWCYLNRPSFKKSYHLCTAKYLLSDNNALVSLHPGQMSIYCGHGMVGLKSTKGVMDIPEGVNYVLSPSENFDPIFAYERSIPYPSDRLLHLGSPCEDVYFRQIPDEYRKITQGDYRRKILWMPTFRKGGGAGRVDSDAELPLGIPLIESREMLERLDAYLARQNMLLVIKLHPMQDPTTYAQLRETDNIKVLTGQSVKALDIDNYRLLACSDALLSDYSSVAYSFLMLDRPLGFVLTDLKDYTRGLCVENVDDYLVGHKIFSFDDMERFFRDLADDRDDYRQQRLALRQWLFSHCDGNSCQRLAEFMGL